MDIIRVQEIMSTDPDHARLRHEPAYESGSALVIDKICPMSEAAVPIRDSAFLHADAVYDVISVSRGSFFRLQQHQDRFAKACEIIRVRNPFSRDQENTILHRLVALTGFRDAYVW